jgi:hypothetical protein
MATRCISCGHLDSRCISCGHLDCGIKLNCSECGSFYTEIIVDEEPQKVEFKKTAGITDKIKHALEQIIPRASNHDD